MSPRPLTALGTLCIAGLLGCVGVIFDPPSSSSTPPGTPPGPGGIACDPNATPSATDLQRLTAVHYRNTLTDLFAGVAGVDVNTVAADALARLPPDALPGSTFTRMDTRLSQRHVQTYFDVADAVARAFEASPDARRALIGDCANAATLTAACIDAFLDRFAWRAFRRPLEPDERARFQAMNDGTHPGPEMVRGLVFAALMSPQFLYYVEVGGAAIDGDARFSLDAYALAARLAYHFWRSMPDQGLFAAAADGSLLTDAGYAAQVQRVFDDPRTRQATEAFFREWLVYDQVGGFPDTPVFNAFAGADAPRADRPALLDAMRTEVDALVDYVTWTANGTMRDLLVSDLSVTRSPQLAALYGIAPWDGNGAPPRFAPGQRSGILSRAAFLITGAHETNPVIRGVIVRRRLLCQDVHAPDPATLPPGSLTPPVFRPDMTTRQRYELKTQSEPCASCHAQFNPIGFVLERYDALGRYRTTERMLDPTSGAVLAELALDTTATPRLTAGDTRPVSDSGELMARVADTGLVEACFARNYFRYTFGRQETAADGCALERIRAALAGVTGDPMTPGSLRAALRAVALDPSFRQRVVGAQN